MGDVEFEVRNGIGRIMLNRSHALNALTPGMVSAITAHLRHWRSDPGVRVVVITGAGERGLCAGGDIRSIYHDARSGGTASLTFWSDEYRMNAAIARYPKPFLAIMDGVVMGGGVGVSAHGSHRVVTDRSRVAMPEVGIGFIPDVGGTYLLSRAPGQLGVHIALTAAQLSGSDTIYCGLADHFVLHERLPELLSSLTSQGLDAALAMVTEPAPPSQLATNREWIDRCYSADTVEEILARLHDSGAEAVAAAKEIETKSPTALKVTLRALRSAARLPDLEAVLAQEYRISYHALTSSDLIEGVRAQIIDKDRSPQWSPPTLAEVNAEIVDAYFTNLGENELSMTID